MGDTYKVDNKTSLVYVEEIIITKAAEEAFEYLFNKEKRQRAVEKNFEIGKENFSMEYLNKMLTGIIAPL